MNASTAFAQAFRAALHGQIVKLVKEPGQGFRVIPVRAAP